MNFTAETTESIPEPLATVDLYQHSVRQPNVRRIGKAWIDTAMVQCYASPSDVGRPALVKREGHVITDGAKRAVLFVPPGVVPTDDQCALVAEVAGIGAGESKPFETLDAAKRPPEHAPNLNPVWLSDPVVAYAGHFTSDCGHYQDVYLLPRETFPRCEACGRHVRWRRL